jgi:hypothetical protein
MNSQQILYEADLPQTGKSLKRALSLLITAGLAGIGFSMLVAYPGHLIVVIFLLILVGGMAFNFRGISKWSRKQGCYKVYLDSIGLHVHSDEPVLGRSFSVSILNLNRLIRKRVGNAEDLEYEYFVEEKSGERHQVGSLFTNYDMNAMDVFEAIARQFPSVKIVAE